MTGAGRRRWLLRAAVSGALLAIVATWIDLDRLADRLLSLQPGWALGFLALSVAQIVGSAWRWRWTAARLGLRIPLAWAIAEYWLATFLNQLVPGGVVGDVGRAWRHASSAEGDAAPDAGGPSFRARAIHAVVLERTSGQVVMIGMALVSVAWLLAGVIAAGIVTGLLLLLAVGVVRRNSRSADSAAPPGGVRAEVLDSTRRALLSPDAFPVQLATSAAIVATYLAGWIVAARAVGVETPAGVLLPLVAPVLVTMLIPLSIAGWGVREGGAALVWSWVGLDPADGIAISVTYGVLVLLASTPGAIVALIEGGGSGAPPADPDRRADPPRSGSTAPADASPRPASRSPEG